MVENQGEGQGVGGATVETEVTHRRTPAETRPVSLLTWTLATADTVLFVLLGVLAAHASGELAGLIAGLNTLVGVAVFCYLWALTLATVRWVNRRVSLAADSTSTLVLHGLAAGSATGVGFLLGPLAVLVVLSVTGGPFRPRGVVLVTLIGTGFAAVIGAIVGLLAGLLDIALYRLSGSLLPGTEQ